MDLYQRLGLTPQATLDQIKSAYRQLALKNHPDKGGDTEVFKQLSNAYQILSNQELRDKYDQSLPIPETELIAPLKVFADCFNLWLKQYPLIEFMLKDSCHNVIDLLNHHHDSPIMQLLIDSLIGHDHQELSHQAPINLSKKVYVTMDDIYIGKRYPHQFMVTNEDLRLSNDYKIINPEIHINIPLDHSEIELESELGIINHKNHHCYAQPVLITLEVVMATKPANLIKIGDFDLLLEVDLNLNQLIEQDVLTIEYLNHKVLRFNNPHNYNLKQLYRIANIALPNRELKRRGNLYLQFNLVIHQDQKSMIIDNQPDGYIYQLIPVPKSAIYLTDDRSEQISFDSPDKLILKQI